MVLKTNATQGALGKKQNSVASVEARMQQLRRHAGEVAPDCSNKRNKHSERIALQRRTFGLS
jgi:hypothetical protein